MVFFLSFPIIVGALKNGKIVCTGVTFLETAIKSAPKTFILIILWAFIYLLSALLSFIPIKSNPFLLNFLQYRIWRLSYQVRWLASVFNSLDIFDDRERWVLFVFKSLYLPLLQRRIMFSSDVLLSRSLSFIKKARNVIGWKVKFDLEKFNGMTIVRIMPRRGIP